MLLLRLRPFLRDPLWVIFFAGVVVAWAALYLWAGHHPSGPLLGALGGSLPDGLRHGGMMHGAAAHAGQLSDLPFLLLVLMWALMGLAMMAPTAVPLFAAYRSLTLGRAGAARGFAGMVAGYCAVWAGFALLASALQWVLSEAALLTPAAHSRSDTLTAALLGAAGLYQFSALKAACLSNCQAPLMFVMSRWRAGFGGAARMGLEQGAVCLGCCWALMLLAFVGGTMNLVWMGGAMLLMALEKLPGIGDRLTKPLGIALLAAALLVAARSLGVDF